VRSSQQFTIGILASQARVSAHTILYYERQGLLPRARRSAAGYRLFCSNDLRRVSFIRQAQRLGFSLKEIKALLALQSDPTATCSDVGERIAAKLADVDAQLRALRETRRTLLGLTTQCTDSRPVSACPLLRELELQPVSERPRSIRAATSKPSARV